MLSRLRMGTKIFASFAVAVLLMVVMGVVAWVSARDQASHLAELADTELPANDALWSLHEAHTSAARAINASLLRRADAALRHAALSNLASAFDRMDAQTKAFEALPRSPEEDRLWADAREKVRAWRERADSLAILLRERDRLLGLGRAADDPEIQALDARSWARYLEARGAVQPVDTALGALLARVQKEAQGSRDEGHAAVVRGSAVLGLAILLGAGLLGVLGLLLARTLGETVRALTREAGALRDAVAAGRLGVRGDVGAVGEEFRPIVAGLNETMDAFQRPLALTVEYVSRISRGDLPPPIAGDHQGDFNAIQEALNRCVASISGLIGEMGRMSAAHERGDTDAAVDAARFEGAYRTVAEGVNAMVGAHVEVNRRAMAVFAEFGRGNLGAGLERLPGKKRAVNDAIDQVRGNLQALLAELHRTAAELQAGDNDARVDEAKFQGAYRELASGFNESVQMYVLLFREVIAILNRYGDGDFEPALRELPGKQARATGAVEQLRTNLRAVAGEIGGLIEASRAGRTGARARAEGLHGDWARIVGGLNETLDQLTAPVNEAVGALEQLAGRDLRARVSGSYQGDHARIQEAVNGTAAALHDALAQVSAAVDQVSSAATQIAASSQAVASGASEQASSLEETSSSIESVAGMTRQSADNAQQASTLAASARAAATEGAAAVDQLQGAMGKIRRSAEGTSQIIRDINDIAFQTNLLALNAAVEAARAGEAGRGFAVVAEEVRSLALRAKEAAQKTEELIRQSVREAGEGELSARHVAGKLGEIVQGVEKVTAIVSEIAAAAREQTSGIEQVNRAVVEMDKVTQQNAASAEESSSAASELSGQAEELAAMVAGFRLEQRAPAHRPALRPASGPAPAPRVPRPAAAAPKAGGTDERAPIDPEQVFPLDEPAELRDF